MRTLRIAVTLLSTVAVHFTALAGSTEAQSNGAMLTIKIRDSKLRSGPKLWAPSVRDLKFGDQLAAQGTEQGWFKVKTSGGAVGYVHPSAVTDRKVVLASTKAAQASVDASDVVLAGKGFNKDIEREFAQNNPESNFKAVDQVAALRIPDQDLARFLRDGKLGKGEL